MPLSRPVLRRVAWATAAALAVGIVPFVGAAPTASAAPKGLLFTEYVEGSSNNKALEIYNGTGTPVDLAAGNYAVNMYFNGATSAALAVKLTGSVAPGDVYVLAQASASVTLLGQADQVSSAAWYNGDDAITLVHGDTTLDAIGQIGVDPGSEWGTGLTSTADNTLRRKESIQAGDTNGGDVFDPTIEWDGFAIDSFEGVGAYPGLVVPADTAPSV